MTVDISPPGRATPMQPIIGAIGTLTPSATWACPSTSGTRRTNHSSPIGPASAPAPGM
ncbi:Uncharacterised protein [Kytococcus sedentarius]|nr:Uncharacterised protein [Kytococcus sedentarius]